MAKERVNRRNAKSHLHHTASPHEKSLQPSENDTSLPLIANLASLTPSAVLQLQRLVGNRYLAQHLQRKPTIHLSTGERVQRTLIGLAIEDRVQEMIQTVLGVDASQIATWQQSDMQSFLHTMYGKITELLQGTGTPFPEREFQALGAGTWAEFSPFTWKITINKSKLQKKPWTIEDLHNLAVTLYHETRHAEQYFLMARYVASQYAGKEYAYLPAVNDLAIQAARKLVAPDKTITFGKELYEQYFTPLSQPIQGINAVPKEDLLEVNKHLDEAQAEVEKVKAIIIAYNHTPPGTLSGELVKQVGDDKDKSGRDAAGSLFSYYSGTVGTKDFEQKPFLKYLYDYLVELRVYTLINQEKVRNAYRNHPLESDAWALETRMHEPLNLKKGNKTSLIPDPKQWT